MLAAYVSGGISGAHFNPAVTLAFAVARKFDWRNVDSVLGGADCRRLLRSRGGIRRLPGRDRQP